MTTPNQKKRRPPYYPVYGADIMNDERYYRLGAEQRGLFDSIRNVCWSNDSVPADPAGLALAVRLPANGIEANLDVLLSNNLVARLTGDPKRVHVPELTDQMLNYLDKREQCAANAAKGGRTAQERNRQARSSDRSSECSTEHSSGLNCTEVNCDDVNGTGLKSVYKETSNTKVDEPPVNPREDHNDFVRDMEETEARMEASNLTGRRYGSRPDAAH